MNTRAKRGLSVFSRGKWTMVFFYFDACFIFANFMYGAGNYEVKL